MVSVARAELDAVADADATAVDPLSAAEPSAEEEVGTSDDERVVEDATSVDPEAERVAATLLDTPSLDVALVELSLELKKVVALVIDVLDSEELVEVVDVVALTLVVSTPEAIFDPSDLIKEDRSA